MNSNLKVENVFGFFLTFLEGNNKEEENFQREPVSELPCTSCQTKVKFALGVSLQ